MTDLPKITLITPSYNQGDFLARTLMSVLDQNYPNLEFLVFDGGSTDNSVEIIREYADHLTHWESERDRGQSHAINKGFERASGDIIGWLNSDDTLLPGALQAVIETFAQHPEAGAVYGNFIYVDEDDHFMHRRHVFSRFSYNTLLHHDYLGQPAVFWRKEVLSEIGPLNEGLHYGMDWDFFLRMRRATKMVHVKQDLATFRLHKASKTSAEGDQRYKNDLHRIHQTNRVARFRNASLDRLYFRFLKIYSMFLRLWTVLRDNPIGYLRIYKHITGGHPIKGLFWRLRNF